MRFLILSFVFTFFPYSYGMWDGLKIELGENNKVTNSSQISHLNYERPFTLIDSSKKFEQICSFIDWGEHKFEYPIYNGLMYQRAHFKAEDLISESCPPRATSYSFAKDEKYISKTGYGCISCVAALVGLGWWLKSKSSS